MAQLADSGGGNGDGPMSSGSSFWARLGRQVASAARGNAPKADGAPPFRGYLVNPMPVGRRRLK